MPPPSFNHFFNNNLLNECKWNIGMPDDDGTSDGNGTESGIGLDDAGFPKKWIAVIMDFSVDFHLVDAVVSGFIARGYPELATQNEFAGPKFINLLTYDIGRDLTTALFETYNKLGVDLVLFFDNSSADPQLNLEARQCGGENKHMVVKIRSLSAEHLSKHYLDRMAGDVRTKGREMGNIDWKSQAVASVPPQRTRTFPRYWIALIYDPTTLVELCRGFGSVLQTRDFAPPLHYIRMSKKQLATDAIEAFFFASKCRGINLVMVFCPETKDEALDARIMELGQMSGIVTQMVPFNNIKSYMRGNRQVLDNLVESIDSKAPWKTET